LIQDNCLTLDFIIFIIKIIKLTNINKRMDNGHEALLENFEFNEQRMKEIEIPIF